MIPKDILTQHVAVLGKTGSGKPLPAYKNDPRLILCHRTCGYCGEQFPVAKKFPDARFCSRRCGLAATLPPDHNARVARDSAVIRGDKQRGRGAGKTYRKRNGRHEHRVVAEESIGRPLAPNEVVHHADGDKQNNAPRNLTVLPSQSEHAKIHDSLQGRRARKVGTLLEADGRRQNISAWARELGIGASTLSYRLRRGWPLEKAIQQKPAEQQS